MRTGILLVAIICLLSCSNEKKEKDNLSPVQENSLGNRTNSNAKRDTVIFVTITSEDLDNYFKPKDTLKLYVIKGDTILLKKSSLVELPDLGTDAICDSKYIYKDDTLTLGNECSGMELITVDDNLKMIYDYDFDCVEAMVYRKWIYYLGKECLLYNDEFEENWTLQNTNRAAVISKRSESFVFVGQDHKGYRVETIKTNTSLDIIKMYKVETISNRDRQSIQRLTSIKAFNHLPFCKF